MSKKIAFLMRYDFVEKSGGDVVQIKNYARELSKKGFECDVIGGDGWLLKVKDASKIFLVNIDRPIETIHYYFEIKKKYPEKEIYLVPIHHPINAINKFERKAKGFFSFLFVSFIKDFYAREKIKNIVRFRRSKYFFSVSVKHFFIDYRQKIKEVISGVEGIVFISEGEKDSVFLDFETVNKNHVIAYNAVSVDSEHSKIIEFNKREYDFVIIGRIESRKNQFSTLKALEGKGFKVALVGPVNPNSKEYSDKVLGLARSSGVEYLGSCDHAHVLNILNNSRVLINASYFEVNPLVDLEASLCGCAVVTTMYSYTSESIPNAFHLDPWDIDSISENSCLALESQKGSDSSMINSSWELAADKILELFEK